eukprot:15442783-Alexandrium_andersonii.AAC.1
MLPPTLAMRRLGPRPGLVARAPLCCHPRLRGKGCGQTWRTWPHLNGAWDQGPDCMSGTFWLKHKQVCFTEFWDFNHGAWGDVKGMLEDTGVFPLWMLLMSCWNINHFNEEQRFHQMREAWDELRRRCHPSKPLFMEHVARMCEDMKGMQLPPSGNGSVQAMWGELGVDCGLAKKGYVINLNRCIGGARFCWEEVKRWAREAFKIEYLALECELTSSQKFGSLVKQKHLSAAP